MIVWRIRGTGISLHGQGVLYCATRKKAKEVLRTRRLELKLFDLTDDTEGPTRIVVEGRRGLVDLLNRLIAEGWDGA